MTGGALRQRVSGVVAALVVVCVGASAALACGGVLGKIWDVGTPISVTITAPAHNRIVAAGSSLTCSATATDSDHWTQGAESGNEADGIASYTWSASAGTFPNGNSESSVMWQAPDSGAEVIITCTVNDVGVVYWPDTGTRDDEPKSASVTVKVIKVDIKQGQTIITDQTQDTIVGRNISLQGVVSPAGVTVTAHQWTVPGKRVAYYDPEAESDQVTQLTNLTSPGVDYYWVDGGDGRGVTYTATVSGQQFSATTTFNVKRPVASIIATTGEVGVDYDDVLDAWKLHFGVRHGGKGIDGIYFERTLTEPEGFQGGSTRWVQVLDLFLLRRRFGENAWERILMLGRLDGAYPYSVNPVTQDSPSNSLSPAFNLYTRDDWYCMYLMYRPTSGGVQVIDVPLRKVDWYWFGEASRVDRGPEFTLDYGGHSENPSDLDCTDHPEWYLNTDNPPDWEPE